MLLNFICSFFLVLFIIKWCQKFGTKEIEITDYNELCFIVFLFNWTLSLFICMFFWIDFISFLIPKFLSFISLVQDCFTSKK